MKKDKLITFTCTEEQREKLKELSRKKDRTVSWIVNKAVEEYIQREGKGNTRN